MGTPQGQELATQVNMASVAHLATSHTFRLHPVHVCAWEVTLKMIIL